MVRKELQGLSCAMSQRQFTTGKRSCMRNSGNAVHSLWGQRPGDLKRQQCGGKKAWGREGAWRNAGGKDGIQEACKKELILKIDLKPALTAEQLDQRVLRDFEEQKNKQFKNAVDKLFPAKLKPVMIELGNIPPEKKVHEISKEERRRFVELIKNFRMTLTGLRGFSEAIITRGGVSVKDVDPGTMESRYVKHLYFAGEVLDLDALTGGFNLQIAWSTGYAAGNAIFSE